MMLMAIAVALWIVCGAVVYGITYGHFTREYGDDALSRADVRLWFLAATGPLGVVITYVLSGRCRHGLRYR